MAVMSHSSAASTSAAETAMEVGCRIFPASIALVCDSGHAVAHGSSSLSVAVDEDEEEEDDDEKREEEQEQEEKEEVAPEDKVKANGFKFQPSVGTWLQPRPLSSREVPRKEVETTATGASKDAVVRPGFLGGLRAWLFSRASATPVSPSAPSSPILLNLG